MPRFEWGVVTVFPLREAIQVHGGAGVTEDFPLAGLWAHLRARRLADGPDEVHKRSVAHMELGRYR
jgi:acyl-CoA dehydrogenase